MVVKIIPVCRDRKITVLPACVIDNPRTTEMKCSETETCIHMQMSLVLKLCFLALTEDEEGNLPQAGELRFH